MIATEQGTPRRWFVNRTKTHRAPLGGRAIAHDATSALSALPPLQGQGNCIWTESDFCTTQPQAPTLPPVGGEGGDAQRRRVGGLREPRVRHVATRLPQ